MAQDNVTILRVQLDEGKTEEQLRKLVLDIEATKKAQSDLTAARKADAISSEEYAKKVVDLRTQLTGQQQTQRALTKDLELYRTAQNGEADGYKAVQAALSLTLRQQQELAGSANNSSEASQALTKQIAAYRETLAQTDEQQNAFFRRIGQYPRGESIEPLIQKLVQLQEIEKQLPVGSAQAVEAQKQIGFQFGKVNEAAAAAGLAQKDVTAKLADYGERVRPATAELAKLTIAQDEVAKSAGKESAEYAKVGFQLAAARKEVGKVPAELAKVPPVAETATKALGDAATKGLGLFSEQTDKATGLLGKFRAGNDLVKQGLSMLKGAGEEGALGFKAIAGGIALTGIGLFVIAISAVVTYFTQSAEGGKLLAQAMAALGAVVQVATDLVIDLGRNIVYAVTHPIEAIKTMGSTLLNALLHPIDTANGLGKSILSLGGRIKEAASSAADLAAEQKRLVLARRELEVEDVKEQSRVAVLIRLSKDRTLTSQQQLANLREAGRIEEELTTKNIALQERELAAINTAIKLKGEGKSAELKADKAAKEKEIAQTLAARDEMEAKIKARESAFILAERTAAAAAAKQRAKDAVAAKQTENELALVAVEKGTVAELALKQRAIDLAADFELAGEKKTQEQIKLVRAKAQGDKLELLVAFQQKEAEVEKKRIAAQAAEVKREYAEAEKNLTDYLTDKRAAIEADYAAGRINQNTYEKQLNAIDKAGYDAALVNAADYGQDKAKIIKAQADLEIKEAHRVKEEKKKIEETKQKIQDTTLEAATATTDLIIQLYGEESAAGQVAVTAKKTFALAEIAINLERQLQLNAVAARELDAVLPGSGVVYEVVSDALAIASAASASAKILGFRQGGVAYGPSHEQGGIQMYHKSGAHMGEFEGGEVILTKGVWDNPLLRPLASALNVMGGGAPLVPRPHMAVGGVGQPLILDQLRGATAVPFDYDKLARAMSRVKVKATIQDVKAGLDRDAATQRESNS